jgi:hypothetical protein
MLVRNAALLVIAMATPVSAFVGNTAFARTTNLHMAGIADEVDESIGIDAIRRAVRKDFFVNVDKYDAIRDCL